MVFCLLCNVIACGGELSSEEGRFASPGYPGNYPDRAECVWILGGAPGNKVRLTFLSLDIEESTGCNGDYVEIHAGSEEGTLLGHYCGSDVPDGIQSTSIANVTGTSLEAETLWIKFNSDAIGTRSGFLAQYSLGNINIGVCACRRFSFR